MSSSANADEDGSAGALASRVPCPRHVSRGGACTGCPWMHLDDDARAARHLAALRDVHGLRVDAFVAAPSAFEYRYSAKRVVGGAPGALVFGSYVAGSHALADMDGCLVDHPRLVAAFAWLAAHANAVGITAYDETTREGVLRYAWAKTNGTHTLLCLVVATLDDPTLATLRSGLEAELVAAQTRGESTPLDGLSLAEQRGTGNSMQGDRITSVWGTPDIAAPMLADDGTHLVLDESAPRVGPLGFLQPNPVVAGLAHRDLVEVGVDSGVDGSVDAREVVPLALDLYAGSGATTRALRRVLPDVRPCERHPESARHLGVEPNTTEAFLTQILRDGLRPGLVVANPPRAGMGAAVCESLRHLAVPELRVMSCSPRSFVRDLAWLSAPGPSGHYVLERVRAYDTLPHTTHVELVAVLRWRSPATLTADHE
jgi:23S rRNA (uracil1939-C5)-methyltransferase